MSWIALSLAALFGLLLAGVLYVYGWFGRRPSIDPTFALPVEGDETGIDKQLAPLLEAARSGENAVALISDNIEAFVARALSARRAGRSLDLQYYYWKDDLTGFLLTREVIRAADRGVRVRLLLDDVNAGIHDRLCISLDAHPNVDVRLFNPSRARTDRFRRGFELAIRAFSATRRMHNKLWIADGRLAISGGRNIGDAYFDAAELANFRDLDVWMAGPVVDQATAMFDLYWNSPSVLPIAALRTPRKHFLPALREALDQLARTAAGRFYLEKVQDAAAAGPGAYWGSRTLYRSANLRLAFDPPEKALMQKRQNWLLRELFPLIKGAKRDLRIISPLFHSWRCGNACSGAARGEGCEGGSADELARGNGCRSGTWRLREIPQVAAGRESGAVRAQGTGGTSSIVIVCRCSGRGTPACTPRLSSSTASAVMWVP